MSDGLDPLVAQYEAAYERHAVAEQVAALEGDIETATTHHKAALLLAWSLTAELDDKPPQDKNRRDWCYCPACVLVPFRRIA